MLFNSLEFAVFFTVVFIFYWFVFTKYLRLQNLFIVTAGYFFYGWWDWRFLVLLFISSLVDYIVALKIETHTEKIYRKIWLIVSFVVNIGILGFFKYYNFFIDSFSEMLQVFGFSPNIHSLHIILPVGISFYTFQTMSYTIDVYHNKLKPTKDIVAFFAFVSFFPSLVAGPIERAVNLLPQFLAKKFFDYTKAVDGMRQIVWGLFKKIVVADSCALFVNSVFGNHLDYSSFTLLLGGLFFAFQIYCDFSGYSDIAVGVGKLFGINLMRNFNYPYFSRDIAEFWRRWHISLTSWFRDYVYIPLGGNRTTIAKIVRNIFIIFILSGFWHGANWTFITWGVINATLFLPLILTKKNKQYTDIMAKDRCLPNFKEIAQIMATFCLVTFGWIFFRSESINQAFSYIGHILSFTSGCTFSASRILVIFGLITYMFVIEWISRKDGHGLEKIGLKWHPVYRHVFYLFNILIICGFALVTKEQTFIYFQF